VFSDLVVISGYSGAGKTLAMQVFEDSGYFCVDNLPAEMIRSLAELFMHEGSKVEKAAVVSDLRGGEYFEHLNAVLDELAGTGVNLHVLFLEAEEQTLVTRYKETRRRHPLADTGDVAGAVRREGELLAPIRARADVVVDTTGLSANALRRRITSELLGGPTAKHLTVTFVSFGHKHGPPRDADLAFDVRFLANPHYDPALRPKTGREQAVVDYIAADGRLQEFYDHLIPMLEYLLPQYVAEGKSYLMVAIGCTGGRHRSVAIAEHLAGHFKGRDGYLVEAQHRDVDRTPSQSAP
jgi:UPF0042 nucleotide-binding protein